jgi:hypothetical protein
MRDETKSRWSTCEEARLGPWYSNRERAQSECVRGLVHDQIRSSDRININVSNGNSAGLWARSAGDGPAVTSMGDCSQPSWDAWHEQ